MAAKRLPTRVAKKKPKLKKRTVESAAATRDPILPAVNPVVEHVAPNASLRFPIVAIGASAGGLEAITALLKALPANAGMAFVVIQHLSATHDSALADILGRATEMPVSQVDQNTSVEPNHVYVIAPRKMLAFGDGVLQLAPRTDGRGPQRVVDRFMRSLAEEHGHKSIAVILSGTGNDGTLGIREIKAAGGLTFAQDATAAQDGMPQSAIATGAVDFVLAPDAIGREIARLAHHPYVSPALETGALAFDEPAMQRILALLRHATGVSFDGYKRSTLYRRIARRILVHKLDGVEEYLRHLEANPGEIEQLFQDMLINVTSFFRNPEAYESLKTEVFPKLTTGRPRHEQIRIWALGCSTGEEAYSLAMCFTEYLERSGRMVEAQIFATDLNGVGIERARTGIYSKGIAQDVSRERLERFFIEVDAGYRIAKPIRDMCVFARQNVLADPPFSRLDLIACRNMLIYLEGREQRRLIPMLHYALRNHGYLWLGGSETIGAYRELFDAVDTKNKIYAKKLASTYAAVPAPGQRWEPRHIVDASPTEARVADAQREADRLLLGRYSPPAVVVGDDLSILHFAETPARI